MIMRGKSEKSRQAGWSTGRETVVHDLEKMEFSTRFKS